MKEKKPEEISPEEKTGMPEQAADETPAGSVPAADTAGDECPETAAVPEDAEESTGEETAEESGETAATGEDAPGPDDGEIKEEEKKGKKGKKGRKRRGIRKKLTRKQKVILIIAGAVLLTAVTVLLLWIFRPRYHTDAFRQVGNVVTFGRYRQDAESEEAPENLEWIVLEYDAGENRSLLITRYGIDLHAFHDKDKYYPETVTWETCELRDFANGEFLRNAFNLWERRAIVRMQVINEPNPQYGTEAGEDTLDSVFLLSVPEVLRYFHTQKQRICAATEYALKQGVYESDVYTAPEGLPACYWLLRTPGKTEDTVSVVCTDGIIRSFGYIRDNCVEAFRPAMWVDLDSME